jgi:hypothetical protein
MSNLVAARSSRRLEQALAGWITLAGADSSRDLMRVFDPRHDPHHEHAHDALAACELTSSHPARHIAAFSD